MSAHVSGSQQIGWEVSSFQWSLVAGASALWGQQFCRPSSTKSQGKSTAKKKPGRGDSRSLPGTVMDDSAEAKFSRELESIRQLQIRESFERRAYVAFKKIDWRPV
jgi:hypothetical protein